MAMDHYKNGTLKNAAFDLGLECIVRTSPLFSKSAPLRQGVLRTGKYISTSLRPANSRTSSLPPGVQAFQVGSVRITSAKTRWGSCSGKNNLNFTYRLSMAPLSAVEYVVVHELMHTRIKNHSPQFWHAVEAVLPHWKKERVWLRKNGLKLTLD